VAAERAAGGRTILPDGTPWARRSRFRYGLIAACAAAAVGAVMVNARSRGGATVVSDGVFIGTAYAEQIASAPSAPALHANANAIRPRRYTYRIDFIDANGRSTPDGGGSIAVAATTFDGMPALRVELNADQTIEEQRRTMAETLTVAREDLHPLSRRVHVRPYRRFSSINIVQRFTRDSVLGEMTTDGGIHRPIARRLPPRFAPFLSDAMAPLALSGVQLASGMTTSLSLIGWAVVPMDVFHPVTLRVIGEELIATATGSYDCWKLEVIAGADRRIEWVRKSDGLGLRSDDTQLTARGHRRFELVDP